MSPVDLLNRGRAALRSAVRDAGDGRDPTWHDRLAPILADIDQAIWFAAFASDACRVCGCTDDRACEGGCHWVEPDLCSVCAEADDGAKA